MKRSGIEEISAQKPRFRVTPSRLLAYKVTSGTGIVTPFLTFQVSKVIEACKRFGRGCKPRPASGVFFRKSLTILKVLIVRFTLKTVSLHLNLQ